MPEHTKNVEKGSHKENTAHSRKVLHALSIETVHFGRDRAILPMYDTWQPKT
jgi:hypothetical protein